MKSECPRCGKVCTYHAPSKRFYCLPCEHDFYTTTTRYDVLTPLPSSYVSKWWAPDELSYTRPSFGAQFNGTWTMEEDVQRLRHLLPLIADKILYAKSVYGLPEAPWVQIKAAINLQGTERELRAK